MLFPPYILCCFLCFTLTTKFSLNHFSRKLLLISPLRIFFFFQSVGVAGMKVEEFDGSHFSANPDIFKRINALLDHSLDITVPISLQGQDRKRGKHLFFLLLLPLPPLLSPPLYKFIL